MTAPHMTFLYKLGLANLWMLGDLVSGILGKDENTDAIQRTTTAITIVQAGFKARGDICTFRNEYLMWRHCSG